MEHKYRVKKILNNNVVVGSAGFQEVIIVGLGIGFNAKPLQWVDQRKIEKVFVLEQEEFYSTLNLIQVIPQELLLTLYRLIEEISHKTKLELDNHAYLTLIDHINFAIERLNTGKTIHNFMVYDLKILYPDEFDFAQRLLTRINETLNVALVDDEVGFLTMHVVNGSNAYLENKSSILTDMVMACMNIIRDTYLISLKLDDPSTQRTMIHLKMLIQRVMMNKQIDNADVILYNVINEFESAYKCALKIQEYIENRMNSKLNSQEIVYLTIHLNRLEHMA